MKCIIADFAVEFKNHGRTIDRLCADYAADFDKADYVIEVSPEEIEAERQTEGNRYSAGYIESICAYRQLCYALPKNGAFLLHAAVIRVGDRGIAFLARSGTGKTTHMLLWRKLLGDALTIINGDKPIVRILDGVPYAYGTPWCGKEGFSCNQRVELTDICFIERSLINQTEAMTEAEAVMPLMQQILMPQDAEAAGKTLEMLDRTVKHCRVWKIKCNTEPEAAEASYAAIFGKR